MATSFATMTSTAPRIPLGRTFSTPPAARHKLQVVPSHVIGMPMQSPTYDPQATLDRFIAGKTRHVYLPGESIYSQGDHATTVFYVQSGAVKLTVVSMSGKEAVIAHLPTGSFFGEAALADEPQRMASANALESSTVVRIDKAVILNMLHYEPEFAAHFRAHLLARNNRLQADLVDHLFNSSEKRLARLLMLMANYGQESKPIPAIAKISQEALAEMIGTTRSRVSFFLNRFRDLGYIDYDCAGMRINSSLVNIVLNS